MLGDFVGGPFQGSSKLTGAPLVAFTLSEGVSTGRGQGTKGASNASEGRLGYTSAPRVVRAGIQAHHEVLSVGSHITHRSMRGRTDDVDAGHREDLILVCWI